MAFRPVLPSELIHQEAFQALSRKAEVKSVRGGEGAGGLGAARFVRSPCTKAWEQTPPPRLEVGGAQGWGAGALGTLYGALGVF